MPTNAGFHLLPQQLATGDMPCHAIWEHSDEGEETLSVSAGPGEGGLLSINPDLPGCARRSPSKGLRRSMLADSGRLRTDGSPPSSGEDNNSAILLSTSSSYSASMSGMWAKYMCSWEDRLQSSQQHYVMLPHQVCEKLPSYLPS